MKNIWLTTVLVLLLGMSGMAQIHVQNPASAPATDSIAKAIQQYLLSNLKGRYEISQQKSASAAADENLADMQYRMKRKFPVKGDFPAYIVYLSVEPSGDYTDLFNLFYTISEFEGTQIVQVKKTFLMEKKLDKIQELLKQSIEFTVPSYHKSIGASGNTFSCQGTLSRSLEDAATAEAFSEKGDLLGTGMVTDVEGNMFTVRCEMLKASPAYVRVTAKKEAFDEVIAKFDDNIASSAAGLFKDLKDEQNAITAKKIEKKITEKIHVADEEMISLYEFPTFEVHGKTTQLVGSGSKINSYFNNKLLVSSPFGIAVKINFKQHFSTWFLNAGAHVHSVKAGSESINLYTVGIGYQTSLLRLSNRVYSVLAVHPYYNAIQAGNKTFNGAGAEAMVKVNFSIQKFSFGATASVDYVRTFTKPLDESITLVSLGAYIGVSL